MKNSIILFLMWLTLSMGQLSAQEAPSKEYQDNYKKVMERTQWWREARFGMFIHFGAYAVPARGEWVKSNERLTTGQYQKYVDEFNPKDFDAKAWAKTAKAAEKTDDSADASEESIQATEKKPAKKKKAVADSDTDE